ncbi:hypothetical protein BSKO_12082 [Bryopsis sp. KO-2023]|nr:hypothetical protein BSKO_12082 [Bryopsis sp. KO-2023]
MASQLAQKLLGAPAEAELAKDSPEWALHMPAQEVDAKDVQTPDSWIPRNPVLRRLTGDHPLNCEPPMQDLLSAGFITPVSLQPVCNHGAVPKLDWSTHRINVSGLVDKPLVLSMDDITKLPSVTLPVSVTSAGNRGKEMNLVKTTTGASWGTSATACSYWTGVRLCDLLRMAGVKSPQQGAKFVCFAAPKGERAEGEDGSYGTSISVVHAVDPANDVIVAYKQNGRWLTPDHGFPVRMIIPGSPSGRMIKWLSEITVTTLESQNFYHFHNNRALPSHVDEKLAKLEGWLSRPEYLVNELNINSVISRPGHDEFVSLKKNTGYQLKGFASSGGGRQVIRVETSVDEGQTWQQSTIHRFENPTVHGKSWCWVFWSIEVETVQLMACDEVIVRAWDNSQNCQTADISWNMMGVMNNCYYRVKVHKMLLESGEIGLRFQHPAPNEVGQFRSLGWREEDMIVQRGLAEAELHIPKIAVFPAEPPRMTKRSRTESSSSLNTALPPHPSDSVLSLATLNSIPSHSDKVSKAIQAPLIALNPRKKIPFTLVEKENLSRDARRLRFALQSPKHVLGLPVGKHMFFYANVNGEPVMRAYTPSCAKVGYFELVIKVYFANEHPRFPEGGKMSQHFESMQIGDTIDVKGPLGHFEYTGPGQYLKNRKPFSAKKIVMIAGGTGITPCYQVAQHILSDPEDDTEISLLYANKCEEDILLREDLDEWSRKHKNFSVHYTLDSPPENWQYSKGFISKQMVADNCLPFSEDGIVCMCGPGPMIELACKPNLEKCGWKKDQFIVF